MQVLYAISEYRPPSGGVALTIGNFDGVHLGHRKIIQRLREISGRCGLPSVVLTFDPHPAAVLAPQRAPARLVTLPEKLHLLESLQVDACIVLHSDPALLSLGAGEFLELLAQRCRPRAIVEGLDFNFGRGRQGSVQTLRDFGGPLGFTVEIVETARCDDLPGAPSVHSSAVRAALREGRVDIARLMLARPYRIAGVVGSGAGRGAGLGFPTANLQEVQHLLPQEAVYAAVAQLEDNSLYLAAVNIGSQPTFGDSHTRIEAHLLDSDDEPTGHEWLTGRRVGLYFLMRLRGQMRFGSVDELKAQIGRDVAATRVCVAALRELESSPILPL